MRLAALAFSFVLGLGLAGCGDDTTAPAADMTVAAKDLSGPVSCGTTGVAQSCASVSPSTSCFVCDFAAGGGHCARPCLLFQPDCPAGQTCLELTTSGPDGGTPAVAFEGAGCADYGFCR
jgi:hypothetical protein